MKKYYNNTITAETADISCGNLALSVDRITDWGIKPTMVNEGGSGMINRGSNVFSKYHLEVFVIFKNKADCITYRQKLETLCRKYGADIVYAYGAACNFAAESLRTRLLELKKPGKLVFIPADEEALKVLVGIELRDNIELEILPRKANWLKKLERCIAEIREPT